MNITFLIGNGFDIGMGMKSKFSDFFPIYVRESVSKPDEIRPLSRSIATDSDNWSYFEKEMGRYTEEFTRETANQYIAQMRDFEQSFIAYLKKQEEELSFNKPEEIAEVMTTALTGFYSEVVLQPGSSTAIKNLFFEKRHEPHTYNFLCFNYTSVLRECIETIEDGIVNKRSDALKDIIGKIVYVHGSAEAFPIMGVNDISQIANQELANDSRFCRNVVKQLSNNAHRTTNDKDGKDIIFGSNIICVYGMSFGETDKLWWNRILQWLKEDSNRHLIPFVHDSKFNPTTQFDWPQKEDAIIDCFSSFVDPKEIDVEGLRPRIHLALHKNIFSLDLAEAYREEITEILVNGLMGIRS